MDAQPLEIRVYVPGQYPLVVQGIRQGEGFEYARGILAYAVPDRLLLFLHCLQGVGFVELALDLLLIVVLLALLLAETVVPPLEGFLYPDHRIPCVERIQFPPGHRIDAGAEGIAGRFETALRFPQGVSHLHMGERIQERHIIFVAERVDEPQGIGGEDGVAGTEAVDSILQFFGITVTAEGGEEAVGKGDVFHHAAPETLEAVVAVDYGVHRHFGDDETLLDGGGVHQGACKGQGDHCRREEYLRKDAHNLQNYLFFRIIPKLC